MSAQVACFLLAVISAAPICADSGSAPQISSQDSEFFETSIRPLFAKHCYGCHAGDQQLSGLRVDSREALLKGGKRGPSIVPGDPGKSLLLKALRHEGLKMPIGGRLKDMEIAAVESWIKRDAPWPVTKEAHVSSRKEQYTQLRREHWAFQPVAKVAPPGGSDARPRTAIDRFIVDRLHKSGLDLATPAEKRVLIRRLSYVLTGLPPKAEDVNRFATDSSPGAYERLVDQVLASPHFGEQWARHWLDLVRFGETRGYEWNYEIIGAWRYRDYLTRAFNADVPYDQLVREHIAGDLLPNPRLNVDGHFNESVIGTAFYRLGEAGHDDCVMFREIALDVIDNEIDTLTKTFQGMTVSCARCHDHKLDPIPTEDYYGLYGILNSSRVVTHTIDVADLNKSLLDRLKPLKQAIHEELAAIWKRETSDVAGYMLAALPTAPAAPKSLDSERLQSWKRALAKSAQELDVPSVPWSLLECQTGGDEKLLLSEGESLAARYKREAAEREAFNRQNFKPFASFGDALPNGWTSSGNSGGHTSAINGDFAVAPLGNRAITNVLPKGLYTNLLSARLNGAVRSPDLPKDKNFVSVRVMGGNLGARRTIIDNCAIGENYKVLENTSPVWVKLETYAKEQNLPVFLELVTRSDNPRLPDRPEVLNANQTKLLTDPRSYFGIVDAVVHDGPDAPRAALSHLTSLLDSKPSTWAELARAYQSRIEVAVQRWSRQSATEEDIPWLSWLIQNELLSNRAAATPKLAALIAEYRDIEGRIPEPRVVEGLADKGPGRDFPVLIGGNAKTFGKPAPRRFLGTILRDAPFQTGGSGRRELADLITGPDNPLTARVMVNRIWQHVFGSGIVRSADNFGVLGDKPSHPELLDYLSNEFVEQGWSIKKMIRTMVLSETFKQSGIINPRAREADPQNALLSHYPLRRLEAESIRDSILMSSGELRDTLFGPGTDPHRDQPQDYRKLFSGPLDGAGRRSLYLKVTRMEGARFLETFDYPVPMSARGSRDVTNVPAQALALLNDPFVVLEAERLAEQLLQTPAESVDDRVEQLFQAALARRPTSAERERFRGLASELAGLHGVSKNATLGNAVVWKDLAHTVFNMKEFIYLQ